MGKSNSRIDQNFYDANWFNHHTIEELNDIFNSPLTTGIHKLAITGVEGLGKHDLIHYLCQHVTSKHIVIQHLNFALTKFSIQKFLSNAFQFYLNKRPEFKSFLKSYSISGRQYIKSRLAQSSLQDDIDLDWYLEIFLQFLSYISDKKAILVILENLDQLDGYQFERLETFIQKFKEFPVYIITTINPEGTFKHKLADFQQLELSKLSIQSVEKSIQAYFQTSAINARLITNHCFLKTNGNALKIRYLLFTFYGSILKKNVIEIPKLQHFKIPGSWEELFPLIFFQIRPENAGLLIFLSYLNEPILAKDLQLLLTALKLKNEILGTWLKSGILREVNYRSQNYYDIRQPKFQKWLRSQASLEDLKMILLTFGKLLEQGKLAAIYLLSELVYGINEIEMASRLSILEGEKYLEKGELDIAADRFYFALRISESHDFLPSIENDILEKLGDIYLSRKSYENAFEIFKRLKLAYGDSGKISHGKQKQKWMQANLKMIRALVEMDSFQEARYLIREIRVKKFTDTLTLGKSLELLGDIESNLARVDQAQQNYWEAFNCFQKAEYISGIYSVYLKLRTQLKNNPEKYKQLIDQVLKIIPARLEFFEKRGWILRDRMRILLNEKKYRDALKDGYELRRLLQKIYYPRLKVQLAFYLGEIYVQLGKWQLAMSTLRAINKETYVIHRPELNVQTLIQLGMIFKEQAMYGDARRILNSGMEICFRNGLHEQINEIKLHLGHIYLLVHSLIRANELLKEVHEWSERYQVTSTHFLAKLYLSYYELQQNRFENSRKLLSGAKKILNIFPAHVDSLNFLFYLTLWLLKMNRMSKAKHVVDLMLRKAKNYPRYQATSYFLMGKVYLQLGNQEQSQTMFNKAISLSRRWHFPQIQYLVLCDIARDGIQGKEDKKVKIQVRKACTFIEKMAENIGDEILAAQFRESHFHEDLLHYCREHDLLKREN